MKKIIVMMMVVALTTTGLMAGGSETLEPPKECKITIKGTYDGKVIDVNVTVQADNCAKAAGELLKEAINCK